MPQVKLPSGVVVDLPDGASPTDQFRLMVSADPSLQKRYGVEAREDGVWGDIKGKLAQGALGLGQAGLWVGKQAIKNMDYGPTMEPASKLIGALDEAAGREKFRQGLGLSQEQVRSEAKQGWGQVNPRNVAGLLVESAPSMIGGVGMGGIARAMAPQGAKVSAAVMGSALGEGMISAAQTGQQTDENYRRWARDNPEKFIQSLEGRSAMKQAGDNFEQAVNIAGSNVGGRAAILSGITTPAISLATGNFGGKLIGGAMPDNTFSGLFSGVASEGIEEALQSGGEQVAQNVAPILAGPEVKPFEGVSEAMVMGGLTGAVAGGGFGAAAGARQDYEKYQFKSGLKDIQNYLSTQEQGRAERAAAAAEKFGFIPREDGTYAERTAEQEDFLKSRRELAESVFIPAFEKSGLDTRMASEVVDFIAGPQPGTFGEGVTSQSGGNPVIKVAVGLYDEGVAPEQFAKSILGIGRHEIVHGAKEMGVINDVQEAVMLNEAKRRRYVDPETGETRRGTYFEWAAAKYGDQGPEVVAEEAIAELGRAQAAMEVPNSIAYRRLSDRLGQVYRQMTGGLDQATQLYNDLYSGDLVGRANIQEGHKDVGALVNGQPDLQTGTEPAPQPTEAAAPTEAIPSFEINSGLEPTDEKFSYIKDLRDQVEKLGKDPNNLADIRETEKLNKFAGDLKREVNARAREIQEQARQYHEEGKLPWKPGTRFTTPKSIENGAAPWEVTGYFVDPKDPNRYGYRVKRGPEGEEEVSSLLVSDPAGEARMADMGRPISYAEESRKWRPFGTIQEAPPINDNERFSFVGMKAQGLPHDLLAKFIKDEARGRNPSSLYKETGFWRGKDGKVRYEISDAGAELNPDTADAEAGDLHRLPEILNHPELYRAYPIVKRFRVYQDPNMGYRAASFTQGRGLINMGKFDTAGNALSALLHEIQHGIQTLEEMAPGGSPVMFKWDVYSQHLEDRLDKIIGYQPKLSRGRYIERVWHDRDHWLSEAAFQLTRIPDDQERRKIDSLNNAIAKQNAKTGGAIDRWTVLDKFNDMAAFNAYMDLHGEIEARDIEDRAGFGGNDGYLRDETVMNIIRKPSPVGDQAYANGIVLPPFPIEHAPWTQQAKIDQEVEKIAKAGKFSFLRDTRYSPNTQPAAEALIPDPEDFGPQIGMRGDAQLQESLGKNLALQHTALATPVSVLLSPLGVRMGGKMGVYWDRVAVDRLRDKAITTWQSESWPLKQFVVRAIQMGGRITDRTDPVAMQILFHGRVKNRLDAALDTLYKPMARAVAAIGAKDRDLASLAKVSPLAAGLKDVEGITPGTKLMEAYLYARHAPERNKWIAEVRQPPLLDDNGKPRVDENGERLINMAGSGMSDQEAQAIMDWFEKSPMWAKVQEAATIIDAIVQSTNRQRLRAGLIPDWEKLRAENVAERQRIQDEIFKVANDKNLNDEQRQFRVKELEDRMPEDIARLLPEWRYYVPLRGITEGAVDEEDDSPLSGMMFDRSKFESFMNKGSGYSTKGREDPRVKGRSSYAGGLMENVLRQHEHTIVRAQKNNIGRAFLNFIRQNKQLDGMGDLVIENPPPRKIPVIDSRTGKVRMAQDQSWKSDPNVFVVKENGMEIPIIINDPELVRSVKEMSTLGDQGFDSLMKWSRPMVQLMSKAVTTWNLEFPLSNAPRDVQEGIIRGSGALGKRSVKIAPRMVKYASQLLQEKIANQPGEASKLFSEMEKLGAFTGTYGLKGYEETLTNLQTEIRNASWDTMTKGDRALWGLRKVGKLVEGMNDTVEAATRMAVFQTAREHGYSDLRAAQIAKTTTINFNERGRIGPQLGSLYMLANARIQGQANFLSGLTSGAVLKFAAAYGIVGLIQEIWNQAVGGDDEDKNAYEKIMKQQPHVADRSLIFLNPWDKAENGMHRYITIPKAPGFGVFQDVGRLGYRTAAGKMEPGKAALTLLGNIAGGFNISGFRPGAAGIGSGLMPSIAKPFYDIATNEDWTGESVHPTQLPFGVQPAKYSQHFANTPQWAVGTAKVLSDTTGGEGEYIPGFIDLHPDSLDHAVTAYGGGVYTTGERISRLVARGLGQKDLPGQREQTLNDIPFTRRFYGEVTAVTNRKFFDTYVEEYVRLDKQWNALAESNPEEIDSFEKKHSKKLAVAPLAVDYAKELVSLNKEAREIRDDQGLSDAEKVPILKEIKEQQSALIAEGLMEIESAEKAVGINRK